MAITSITRDWGVDPSIVRITSTDNLTAITTAGYLTAQEANIELLNNGEFEWLPSDFVLIYYSNGEGFFTRDATNQAFVAAPANSGLSNTLANGNIFVGNASNVATGVPVSGDVTLSNAGVTAIASGAIVNADVNNAAAIAYSKLAALPSADILVGSAGNVATAVPVTGAVTLTNAGVTALAAGSVALANLAAGITPSHVVKFAGQPTTTGGAAAEAFTVTGAAATDLAFVQVVNNGTANVTAIQAVVTTNTLTVTFSADPGADTVFNYQLLRAAA